MKGISPLIAGVLLVAFTIAIAGLVSQFLISTTEEQAGRTSDSGEEVVNCGDTRITILSDSTSWDGSQLTINVENSGSVDAQVPEILVFNSSSVIQSFENPIAAGETEPFNNTDNLFDSGSIKTFQISVSYHPERVTVTTGCSGRSSTVENDTSDGTIDFERA